MTGETFFVYHLLHGSQVAHHEPAIIQALETAGFVRPQLYVAPVSGFLRATAVGGEKSRIADAARARAQSEECLRKLKVALDRVQASARTPMPDILPLDRLRCIEAVPVRGQGVADHWLVRWILSLPTGRRFEDAFVGGAIVDLRMAEAPISLVSRLRPWSDVTRWPAFAWPGSDQAHDHEHSHEDEEHLHREDDQPSKRYIREVDKPVYTLGGEDEEQRYLAPFWMASHDNGKSGGHSHGVPLSPATAMSLAIGISWEEAEIGARLGVVANNAHGQLQRLRAGDGWRVHWRWFSVANLGEPGELVDDTLDIVQTGVYHICVDVEHRETSAFDSSFLELPVSAERTRQAPLVA
ncbi:hypothetical protein [Microvirga splendida]|uniref:Uncharacterized protein n=1 Tax=Microvirga splendida TaxID=2795727 RepID=A0ABS0Y884_9HYPH|nr:hypothetical protein [Microvirga splendida]MBJ6128506.1 hypothetical protein [Microvirga splendida]